MGSALTARRMRVRPTIESGRSEMESAPSNGTERTELIDSDAAWPALTVRERGRGLTFRGRTGPGRQDSEAGAEVETWFGAEAAGIPLRA